MGWDGEKGNIGRQRSITTTIQIVYQHLMKELHDLLSAHDSISTMIEKCVSIMQVMLQEIPIDDEIEAVEYGVEPKNKMEMLRKIMKS